MGDLIPMPERDTKFFKVRRETAVPDIGFPVFLGLVTMMMLFTLIGALLALASGVTVALLVGNLDPEPVRKPRNKRTS